VVEFLLSVWRKTGRIGDEIIIIPHPLTLTGTTTHGVLRNN